MPLIIPVRDSDKVVAQYRGTVWNDNTHVQNYCTLVAVKSWIWIKFDLSVIKFRQKYTETEYTHMHFMKRFSHDACFCSSLSPTPACSAAGRESEIQTPCDNNACSSVRRDPRTMTTELALYNTCNFKVHFKRMRANGN